MNLWPVRLESLTYPFAEPVATIVTAEPSWQACLLSLGSFSEARAIANT
jgi:hypothetical protein